MRPELGQLTLWGALLLPAMYIMNHGVRRVHTWSGRRVPRQENVGVLVMFYSVIGALVGSLCQPLWTRSTACAHDRRGVVECIFDDVAAPALERATEPLRVPESERAREPARLPDSPRATEPLRQPETAPERRPEPARAHATTSERRPPSGNP